MTSLATMGKQSISSTPQDTIAIISRTQPSLPETTPIHPPSTPQTRTTLHIVPPNLRNPTLDCIPDLAVRLALRRLSRSHRVLTSLLALQILCMTLLLRLRTFLTLFRALLLLRLVVLVAVRLAEETLVAISRGNFEDALGDGLDDGGFGVLG